MVDANLMGGNSRNPYARPLVPDDPNDPNDPNNQKKSGTPDYLKHQDIDGVTGGINNMVRALLKGAGQAKPMGATPGAVTPGQPWGPQDTAANKQWFPNYPTGQQPMDPAMANGGVPNAGNPIDPNSNQYVTPDVMAGAAQQPMADPAAMAGLFGGMPPMTGTGGF